MSDNGGTFGFKGEFNRGFDLPAGVLSDFSVSVSDTGRARLRYNDVSKQLELSVDGGGFVAIATGTGTSPWVEMGGVIRPQNVTDDVVVGAATLSGSETFRLVGDARIEPDDAAGGFNVVDGGGNTVLSATQAGDVTVGNQLVISERVGDPGATANQGKLYTKEDAGVTELFYQASDGTVSQLTPPASGGTPGGANTQVQFNDAGSFGANADFTYDGTNVTTANALFADGGVDTSGAASLVIADTNATAIELAPVPVQLDDNESNAFRMENITTSEVFMMVDTQTASFEAVRFGGDNSGQAGNVIFRFFPKDDEGSAWRVEDATNQRSYIDVDTTNGTRQLRFGDQNADIQFRFFSSGNSDVGLRDGTYISIEERATDPGTIVDQGNIYTKEVGGVTELFYEASDGTVSQLTPTASVGGANTQVQYNNSGVLDGDPDFTFDGTNVTFANVAFTEGGIDLSGGGNLEIGPTNATTVRIGLGSGSLQTGSVNSFSGPLGIGSALPTTTTTVGRANQDVIFPGEIRTGAVSGGGANGDIRVGGNIDLTGNIDKISAVSLSIGASTAASVGLARSGVTTNVFGPLTLVEGTNFNATANFNADVNLGNGSSDTITFVGEVDSDIEFENSSARTIKTADAASTASGQQITYGSADGGAATGAAAGGTGGVLAVLAGDGGVGSASFAAGQGGQIAIVGGAAGTDNGGGGADGGSVQVEGGTPSGGGTGGTVFIGSGDTGEVSICDAGAPLGFFSNGPATQQSTATYTDSTGGTGGTNLVAISGTGDDSTINDNFATLFDFAEEIRSAIAAYGLLI